MCDIIGAARTFNCIIERTGAAVNTNSNYSGQERKTQQGGRFLMNKHIKKLLSIALAIVMLLSAIPLTSIIGNVGFLPTAEAATVTKTQVENKLDKIAKEYPTKSYFSKNGLSCGHASGKSCKNCHLTDILNAKKIPLSKYNHDGWTCWAYASYCFTQCFDRPMYRSNYTVKKVKTSSLTSNELRDWISKNAMPGDIIYGYKKMPKENLFHVIFPFISEVPLPV